MGESRTIVFVAAPETQILDVAGPFQVFVRAAEIFVREKPAQKLPYRVLLASSTQDSSITTNCGLVLSGAVNYRNLCGPIDTLLVAGGTGAESVTRDEAFLIAANIAKLPSVPPLILKDIPRSPNLANRDD